MISDNSIFAAKVKDILAGWITDSSRSWAYTPSAALAGWKGMVEGCKEGYQENIYEYDNDLAVRIMIELLLTSEILKEYPEFQEFSETVKSLDAEFAELLQKDVRRSDTLSLQILKDYPEFHKSLEEAKSLEAAFSKPLPWWRNGVPKYAGKQLADDFFRNYGIEVQVIPDRNGN